MVSGRDRWNDRTMELRCGNLRKISDVVLRGLHDRKRTSRS